MSPQFEKHIGTGLENLTGTAYPMVEYEHCRRSAKGISEKDLRGS
jgi:hypothetical protein